MKKPWADWEIVERGEGWSKRRNPETGKIHVIIHGISGRSTFEVKDGEPIHTIEIDVEV